MTKMTEDQIQDLYKISKDVFHGKKTKKEAKKDLVSRDMKESTGSMYINNFQKMMGDEFYGRSMNESVTRFFLKNILLDYGEEKLKKALNSLHKHYKSYAKHGNSPGSGAWIKNLWSFFDVASPYYR